MPLDKKTLIAIVLFPLVLLACQFESLLPQTAATVTATRGATRTLAPLVSTVAPTMPLKAIPTVPTTPPQITASATDNVRIRATPSTAGAILGRLNQGETAQVTGRTAASDWVQIALPANPAQRGWVSVEFVALSGPINAVPVSQSGPTNPTPLPTRPASPPGPVGPTAAPPQPPTPRPYPYP